VSEGQGIRAALIRRNFLFCLEPACGVAYTRNQRSERTKLATLGVDNRSTATTILAVRSLIELQGDRDLQSEARKLLSFTDNRQDASLQAGHFNDFAQVALLRSALHKATQDKGAKGLGHGELSRSVFDAMQLRFEEYAADPEVRGPARNATHDALRRVIDYYLYRDLLRGPLGGGMIGHVEVHDTSPLMGEDHQHEEDAERYGRHSEEIEGHQILHVILQECLPRGQWWLARPRSILKFITIRLQVPTKPRKSGITA